MDSRLLMQVQPQAADELLNIMRCKIMMLKCIYIVRPLFVLRESQIAT